MTRFVKVWDFWYYFRSPNALVAVPFALKHSEALYDVVDGDAFRDDGDTPADEPFARTESGVILLVDDDTWARTAIRRILTRVGYTVVEAVDGQDALDHYGRMIEPPRGVILDLAMPVMGGLACLEALRARGSVVPVLMISGDDAEHEASGFARRGDARLLQKPFSAHELLGALRETLTPT